VTAVTLIDHIAKSLGIFRWLRFRCTNGVTILMYHKVLPSALAHQYPLPNLVIEQSAFKRQIDWLSKYFEVLTVSDALNRLEKIEFGRSQSKPLACVTFDDGYRDNFDYAVPILEVYGLRGTFFVTTAFIEGTPLWFDRAAITWLREGRQTIVGRICDTVPAMHRTFQNVATLDNWLSALKQLPINLRDRILAAFCDRSPELTDVFSPMTIMQLRQLANSRHEIGAHSITHPILTSLDDAELQFELEQSRVTLSTWTNRHIAGFCYPNGSWNKRVAHIVRLAGYRYACTVRRGLAKQTDNLLELPRRAIFSSPRHSGINSFEAETVGWHDLLRHNKIRFFSLHRSDEIE